MKKPIIKICGIKSAELASEAATLGADFIGIIFHPNSQRYVSPAQAKPIAQATKKAGAIPVAVFANHTAAEMADILEESGISMLQLHGSTARQQHHLLPEKYRRIYVQTVNSDGTINADSDTGLAQCKPSRDLLLFDNIKAGSGQTFNWQHFTYTGPFNFGIAGGLNAENVALAIEIVQPVLLDTSTGVENSAGVKDLLRIHQFIQIIHERHP